MKTLRALILVFLAPLSASAGMPSRQAYDTAVKFFHGYMDSTLLEIQEKSGGYRLPGAPMMLVHGHPTKRSIVLLHGLSDSPYFMGDLAVLFYNQGYNVVVPLLPGNGTRMEDLGLVTQEDWKKAVRHSIAAAAGMGEKVSIGGLSAGGALSVWAAHENSAAFEAVYLFSPALFFEHWATRLTCLRPGHLLPNRDVEVPIRYRKISNNGTCQLWHLVDDLDLKPSRVALTCPIFASLTEYDDVIDVQKTINWVEAQPGEHRILAYTRDGGKSRLVFHDPARETVVPAPRIRHADVTRRTNTYGDELNPRWDDLEKALTGFLPH